LHFSQLLNQLQDILGQFDLRTIQCRDVGSWCAHKQAGLCWLITSEHKSPAPAWLGVLLMAFAGRPVMDSTNYLYALLSKLANVFATNAITA